MHTIPDAERLFGDLIRLGVVAEVDLAAARCVVRVTDDLVTGPLPWLAARAGAVSSWSPPSVGEQVVLLCPEGDIAAGVVLPGVFSATNPAAASDAHPLIKLPDGSTLRFNGDAHVLELRLADAGALRITAPGGAAITGDVRITGRLTVEGDIATQGDVHAGGVTLATHVHLGVKAGADRSQGPA